MINNINTFDLEFRAHKLRAYQRSSGSGIPVLFLHGGGLDSAMLSWQEVISMMPPEYDCFAVDLLGYGESDKPDLTYSVPLYAELVLSVMDQLGLASAHLVGLSLGGGVAIASALNAPERVRSLTLTDAWGLSKTIPFYRFSRWFVNSSWNAKSYRWMGKKRSRVRWLITTSLFGNSSNVSDMLAEELYELLQQPNCNLAWESLQRYEIGKDGITTDLHSHLGELSMPVLIVNGEMDFGVPLKDAKAAAEFIPHAALFIIKGAKHWAQKEYPREFTDRLCLFLQKGSES